jgi:hypothetical protein
MKPTNYRLRIMNQLTEAVNRFLFREGFANQANRPLNPETES